MNEIKRILTELKNNHKILGIKAEVEDEGASFEEVFLLNELAKEYGLTFTLKIGGCGALNDIELAKKIRVNSIVAPMIETRYALKKFTESINSVYFNGAHPELFINIETISGCKKFNDIISSKEAELITGVTIGRFDLAKSLNLGCKDIHGEKICSIVEDLSTQIKQHDKKLIIGGGISDESIKFFKKLNCIDKFETRKIIFDAQNSIKNNDKKGIIKAMEFELLWIEYKKKNLSYNENMLEKRIKSLSERLSGVKASAL